MALRQTKTTGAEASVLSQWLLLLGTAKAMATPVLVSVCFLSFANAFSRDDEGDSDENMLCWLSSRPCLCFIFLLLTVAFCFLFFFRSSPFCFYLASLLFFFSRLFSLVLFFSCSPFAAPVRSLEGLIYSLNMSPFRKDSMH